MSKKEAPMLGLVGMGGGVASLMWQASGVTYEEGNIWGSGMNNYRWFSSGGGPAPWTYQRSSPVKITGGQNNWIYAYKAGGGASSILGINADKQLYIWGPNQTGEWGNNSNNPDTQSTSNTFPNGFTVPGSWISASNDTGATFGIKNDGTLWSWGRNDEGKLGLNQANTTKISSPTQIGTGTDWQAIRAQGWEDSSSVMATKTNGTLWMWGNNQQGQVGQNSVSVSRYSSPVQIPGTNWGTSDTSIDVFNSRAFTCSAGKSAFCIKQDNTLWAWGGGYAGALGLNSQAQVSSPTQIPGTWSSVKGQVSNADNWTSAVKPNGEMFIWGNNGYGQLGQNNRTAYSSPRQLPGTWKIDGTNGGGARATMFHVKADGTFWSWGYAYGGGLGLNVSKAGSPSVAVFVSSPTKMGNDSDWILGGGSAEMTGYFLGGKTR